MTADLIRQQSVVLKFDIHAVLAQQLYPRRYLAKNTPGIERGLEDIRAVRRIGKAGARIPFVRAGERHPNAGVWTNGVTVVKVETPAKLHAGGYDCRPLADTFHMQIQCTGAALVE